MEEDILITLSNSYRLLNCACFMLLLIPSRWDPEFIEVTGES